MATPTIMSFKKRYMNDDAIGTPEMKKPRLEDMFNQMLFDELVVKIFSYLHHKDLLMAAALVCERWERLSMDPDLWRSLDLGYLSDVTMETVEKLLERFKRMKCIKLFQTKLALNVRNIGPRIKDSIIPFIADKNCLQRLNLNRQKELSPSSLASIANCKSLLHLSLSSTRLGDDALRMIGESCIKLKTLEIKFCNITTDGLLPVIQHCTQLRGLNITGCKKVDDNFLIALAAKPSQIMNLDISKCKFTSYGLEHLGKLPKLNQLSAGFVEHLCESVTSNLTGLQVLGLENMNYLSNDGVSTIVRNNPNLSVLFLSDCESVDDAALEIISKSRCQFKLRQLAIRHCSVSESGVMCILNNCKMLQALYCDEEITLNNNYSQQYPHVRINC